MRTTISLILLCLVTSVMEAQLSYFVTTSGVSVVSDAEIHVHGYVDNLGHLVNDGIIYCDADFACEGQYSGVGEVSLQTSQGSEMYMYDSLETLTINKPGVDFISTTNLYVRSLFDLQDGALNLEGQELHIGTPSSDGMALGGSGASFVHNGAMIQNYTAASVIHWPIGDGLAHPIDMTILSIDPGSHWISGEFQSGLHPTAPSSANEYSGHWVFDHSGIANVQANIAAHYDDGLVSGLEDQLSLFGWSDPLWRGATGSGADIEEGTFTLDMGTNTATWDGISEITDFALFSGPAACFGDFDNNGTINTADMLMLLAQFGCSGGCSLDLTGNDIIDTADLLEFLTAFGTDCP